MLCLKKLIKWIKNHLQNTESGHDNTNSNVNSAVIMAQYFKI